MDDLSQTLAAVAAGKKSEAELLAISRRDAERLARYGLTLLSKQDHEAAEACAKLAVRGAPNLSLAWHVLGAASARLKKDGAAIVAYEQALQLDPRAVGLWVDLGELYLRAPAYERAAAALKKALTLDPEGKSKAGKRAQLLIGAAFMTLTGQG